MRNLFKTIYIPNADGSNSAVLATNANTVWVETYKGDNVTGNGTREFPYKNVATANIRAVLIGATHICFRGLISESFSTSKTMLGDDINQIIKFDVFISTSSMSHLRTTITGSVYDYNNSINNIIFNNNTKNPHLNVWSYCIIKKNIITGIGAGVGTALSQCTINGLVAIPTCPLVRSEEHTSELQSLMRI